jgi:hypothetical protein
MAIENLSNSEEMKRAFEIIRQIRDLEIVIKAEDALWVSDEIANILQCYEMRNTEPLNIKFADRVLSIYNTAISRGMVQRNTNPENEKLKRKIVFLQGKLSEYRKKYAIADNDTFESEVTDG